MNKQAIQQEIKETREKLEALEAKLNEPEKWEPKGGGYRVRITWNEGVVVVNDAQGAKRELPFRAKTEEEVEYLAAHLKRQAVLWQLANDLNKGWEPDWENNKQLKYYVEFDHWDNDFILDSCNQYLPLTVYFKDRTTAKKACEILNNQPELME